MKTRFQRIRRWTFWVAISLLLLSMSNSTRYLNPAQMAASPYLYNIVEWEFQNFLTKWVHRLGQALPGDPDQAERQAAFEQYFQLGQEERRLARELRDAAAFDDRVEACQAFQLCGRTVAFVLVERDFDFADFAGLLVLLLLDGGQRHDFVVELAGFLGRGGTHLRLVGVFVLRVAVDSSERLYELDRCLRGGLEQELIRAMPVTAVRRIQLRVGKV